MTSTSSESPVSSLRHISLSHTIEDPEASAKKLIFALRPEWETSPGNIGIKTFTDGITNTLLKVSKEAPGWSPEQIDDASILLRAYGSRTEILIDREREAKSHALLAEHGLAPPLLARFKNGLLYNFTRGQVCTPDDLTTEPVWRGVARRIAEWHARLPLVVNKEGDHHDDRSPQSTPSQSTPSAISSPASSADNIERLPTPNMWSVMLKWVAELPSRSPDERARNSQLRTEIERSFEELDRGDVGLVFAHCDLLSANILIKPQTLAKGAGGDIANIGFIDYEYSTPAPAAFDIANHFAEWVGYDCDYNRIPTRNVRRQFLEDYVSAFQTHASGGSTPHADRMSVDRLFDDVDRYRGIPGLWWGIWALIQATISQIDFNYAEYAELRLAEYWAWRAESGGSRQRKGEEMPLRERRWNQDY
ncbi:MAG: hypothetical protein Q9227_009528 [Pyrenula ochraceoflavens]